MNIKNGLSLAGCLGTRLFKKKNMKNKETLETLITKWQKRQIEYQDIAVNNSVNEHTSKKFTYKAVATRDCWKELLEFTNQEKVYSKQDMIEFADFIQDNFSTSGLSNDYWKNSIQYNSEQVLELFEQQKQKTIYFK